MNKLFQNTKSQNQLKLGIDSDAFIFKIKILDVQKMSLNQWGFSLIFWYFFLGLIIGCCTLNITEFSA